MTLLVLILDGFFLAKQRSYSIRQDIPLSVSLQNLQYARCNAVEKIQPCNSK